MTEFCTLARKDKESVTYMTQKEAIIKALEEHGGRERLPVIYPRVIQLATFKPDSDKQATIRTTLQRHPECFRHSPGKPDGWWELVSFQEEIAELKQQITELIESYKLQAAIPKDVNLIEKMLPEMMDVCMHERMKADPLRIVLRHLGYEEAAAVLDAWIGEKEDELVKALERLNIHIRNITMTGQNATYNENNNK